jgi:poly(3-hydroxybutyrate) depolymerase
VKTAPLALLALLAGACSSTGSVGAEEGDGGGTPASDGGASSDASLSDGRVSPSSDGASSTADGNMADGDGAPLQVRIDVSQTSTSGLSSGAFMAVQFHVAFSSIMKGAAIFAGGPFDCAQGSLTTALTTCEDPLSAPDVTSLVAITNQWATAGDIDAPSNLADQHVFLFGGAEDETVSPLVMDALDSYYGAFIATSSITYESRHAGTGHTFPTLTYGGVCAESIEPWVGMCNYDGAGQALAQIYGTLAAPATTLSGAIVPLAQGDFIANPASHSLADTAYAYVPSACAAGETCRVHVAFHGCEQEATGIVGSAFYEHAGYNEWADTNHIVVLYPQTVPTTSTNPNSCWDFWGYDSADYAKKTGPQMAMVRAMIDGIAANGDF